MKNLIPEILFEDQHLIVISKPAGLLSQGEIQGDPNVVDWLREKWGRPYVGLVHRLDRGTSGAMVVAKRTKAAQRLTESLQSGELERIYIAWIIGELKSPAHWSHWLLKDEKINKVRVVSESTPGAKPASLSVDPVSLGEYEGIKLTLAKFKLETGRSHQIRVQSAHENYPILGDTKYGKLKINFPRPALHSETISFPHPMTREVLNFHAALPEDFFLIKKY